MVTLHLPPELETRIRDEAAREGVGTDAYILHTLERALHVGAAAESGGALGFRESELLAKINLGLSESEWLRYRQLISKSEDEALTTAEQAEYVAASQRIEQANAERMRYLVELAALRKVSLDDLMDHLGLGNGSEVPGGGAGE